MPGIEGPADTVRWLQEATHRIGLDLNPDMETLLIATDHRVNNVGNIKK
jgi:hypothetical protein